MYGFDRLLDGAEKGKPQQRNDYVGNAEWVIHESQARGARVLLWTSLLAVALLLLWAGFGSIDEVVRGEGKVVPSRQVQIIQSLDGGIVEEILVKPGQEVEAGQILLKIDSTRFASSLGENNAEYLSLLAKSARLKALATGEPFVAPEEVLKQAPNLIEMERNAWQARTSELNATVNVAREQLKQRQEELRETIAKRDQASASCGLTSRELQVTRPLLKSGAVSEVDLLRLQRDVARYCGEQKGAEAQIDRIQASIKEAQSKLEESELNIRNQARNELSETNTSCPRCARASWRWPTGSSWPRCARCAAPSRPCSTTRSAAWCSRARTSSRSCPRTTRCCWKCASCRATSVSCMPTRRPR